ncbi:MAG: ATP-binding cassette domain-containing protein [Rhodothermaceae bacterium]
MVFDSIIFGYNDKNILNGIYLKIPKGSIVGLYGVNGSGKSTLLKIGCGYLKANDGNIFINQESYYDKPRIKRFQKIAYLSQNSFLPPDLTIKKIILNSGLCEEVFFEDKLVKKLYKEKIKSLSVGELRYFEIKLLFALDREYYLLDEPFSGIAPIMIEQIIELIKKSKTQNKGILITEHYYRYVRQINDTSYILTNGKCHSVDPSNIDAEFLKLGYIAKPKEIT